MLNTKFIQKLLKHLWQALVALTTSSVQRLRIIVSCLQRFGAKVHALPGHSTDWTSSTAGSRCAGVPGARCSQAALPLPLHHQITSTNTASGTQDASSSSAPPYSMPAPYIPKRFIPHQMVSSSVVRDAISSSNSFTITRLVPFTATCISRYDDRPLVDISRKLDYIPALMRRFPNESFPWLSGHWHTCVHPEGALYLYNSYLRTYTEGNIDETTFRSIDSCVDDLYNLARAQSAILSADDIELVVQLSLTEGAVTCQYYFVDHAIRALFWLHDAHETTMYVFEGIQGVNDPSHIRYALESEYWTHCERYPNHNMDRVKLLKELREVVMHASAEIIISNMSLSPFGVDELSRILELINHLRENAEDNYFPHSTCIIASFMRQFSRAKFFNFYGLPCARLDADKSVYVDDPGFHLLSSSLLLALNAMLFWAPQARMRDIRRVWVDKCINILRWNEFNRNLIAEWTGITIYSTVMLAVDVSFLAVPNVNISQSQSIGIIAIYLSIIFITGSLIASVLLARQNHRYDLDPVGKMEFVARLTGTFFGVKALATFHSLPYAMFMWGMVFFAVGLLYTVFKSTTTAMLASVVSGCVVVIMFISWFIWAAREFHIFQRLSSQFYLTSER